MWFRVIVVGLLSAFALTGQAADHAPDSAAYLSFFGDAIVHAGADTGTYPGYLNGQPIGELMQLSIADSIGITPEQSHLLVQIGSLCQSDVAALDVRARALVFESRIRSVNEEPTEAIDAQLKALEAKRVEIILGYVQQLRTALGADAFKKTDDYLQAHAGGPFFYRGPLPKKKL